VPASWAAAVVISIIEARPTAAGDIGLRTVAWITVRSGDFGC
jgi:hypothetical protein